MTNTINQPPNFSRKKITKAGEILINPNASNVEKDKAQAFINLWRSNHSYPLNTFNATLRGRVKKISPDALVAQRLKRTPSIIKKLQKNDGMQLARMQDIGGLRVVAKNISQVRALENTYQNKKIESSLHKIDDYISNPKTTGYRSLHLIFKYQNKNNPIFDGYYVELQIRTQLQHAWATAVETIGSFLNQALKSSEGEQEWLTYFEYVSAAFALFENSPVNSKYENISSEKIYKQCSLMAKKLRVIDKLQAFTVAANAINNNKNKGSFHLITLNTNTKTVSITSFSKKRYDEANEAYAEAEKLALESTDIQVVLVATNSAESLKRAYPNYFLDTKAFVRQLRKIEKLYTENKIKSVLAKVPTSI